MGTFSIAGASLVTANTAPAGNSWGGGNIGSDPARPVTNAALLAGINSLVSQTPSLYGGYVSAGPSTAGTWLARFGFTLGDNIIALDGGAAISYNSLPSGIRILTANLRVKAAQYTGANGDGAGNLFLQQGTLTQSADLGQVISGTPAVKTFAYDFSPVGFGTFLDVLNNGFGVKPVFSGPGSFGQEFFNALIDGTYDLLAFTYSFPLNGTNIDLNKNRLITITSGTLNLAQLTVALGTCPVTIVTQTPNLLIFSIPDSCSGEGAVSVIATGNGVQFSGSYPLGGITILATDASGIYTLTPGKTADTLYSSLRDGTTYDVKIPNPYAKTGYIGG